MKQINRFLQSLAQRHPFWVGFTAFVLGNVACNLLSSLIYDFPTSCPNEFWGWLGYLLWFILSVVALIASGWIGTSLLTFLVYPLSTHQAAKPRKVLVCFLSRSTLQPIYERDPANVAELSGQLKVDLKMLAESQNPKSSEWTGDATKPWSWAQVLRMLAFQNGCGSNTTSKLDLVVFVCSPESLPQSPSLIEHIRRYPEFQNIEVLRYLKNANDPHEMVAEHHTAWNAATNGWDFNSYQELEECLRSLLALIKIRGYGDLDIVIDITGGTKITSIAATTVTIGTPIVAQYVSTNPRVTTSGFRTFDIFEYDLGVRRIHQGA
jgi:hypothetical protein